MSDVPETPVELESVRKLSARLDAYVLGVEAFVAAVGIGIAISFTLRGPFDNGMVAAGFIVLAVLASVATLAEWNRERVAEVASLAAGGLGIVMSLVAGLSGFWWYAPVLAVVAFAVCFGTTNRFIVRDERRHGPVG